MSNALGVASVSFVLVDLLNNGLIDRDVSASTGDVAVTALAPDQVEAQQNGKSQLNLFLYNVTQNEAWRNVNLPVLDGAGDRINNSPLALDLYYLLTAYGVEQYHAEILLGYGMQLLHENPVLPRDAIRRSLAAPTQVVAGGSLPTAMLNLFTSDLADQIEQIKIRPQVLTTEEISRLWTAFQAKYRPTAAYQISVVLIESQLSTKRALPVQKRSVQAIPLRKPVISSILSQAGAGAPVVANQVILAGYNLILQGAQFASEDTSVVVGGLEVFPAAGNLTDTSITIPLPAGLLAGSQSVQIVQYLLLGSPVEPHRGVESDPATFTLSPSIAHITVSGLQGSGAELRSGELDLQVNPAVGSTQTVLLFLNALPPTGSPPEPLAYSFAADPLYSLQSPPDPLPPPSPQIMIPFSGVQAGAYLVRVQVDGADSPVTQDASGRFVSPHVTIA